MKKGIALITSLFFISMISLLILENIDYTELIHKENNADVINTQMLISIMDIERDIAKQLKKIKTNELNTWLDKYSKIQVPFDNHTNVKIHFIKLENIYSINDIGKGKSVEKNLEEFFLEADVNYYAFSSFVKDYMKDIGMRVTNSKQVNKIINDYKKSTRYEDIIKIENKLDFFIMGIAYNTSIIRDGLVLYLDAANVKSYPGTGNVWKDCGGDVISAVPLVMPEAMQVVPSTTTDHSTEAVNIKGVSSNKAETAISEFIE